MHYKPNDNEKYKRQRLKVRELLTEWDKCGEQIANEMTEAQKLFYKALKNFKKGRK